MLFKERALFSQSRSGLVWSQRPEFSSPEVPPNVQHTVPADFGVSLFWDSGSMSGLLPGKEHYNLGTDVTSPLCSLRTTHHLTGKACLTLCQTQTCGVQNKLYSAFSLLLGTQASGLPKLHDVVITLTIFMMARMYCSMSRRPWYPTIILSATTRVST